MTPDETWRPETNGDRVSGRGHSRRSDGKTCGPDRDGVPTTVTVRETDLWVDPPCGPDRDGAPGTETVREADT